MGIGDAQSQSMGFLIGNGLDITGVTIDFARSSTAPQPTVSFRSQRVCRPSDLEC